MPFPLRVPVDFDTAPAVDLERPVLEVVGHEPPIVELPDLPDRELPDLKRPDFVRPVLGLDIELVLGLRFGMV